MRLTSIFIFISVLFLLVGCEKSDLKKAQKVNTPESYQLFLKRYPKYEKAVVIEMIIDSLHSLKAKAAGTIAGYEAYLAKYPNGKFKGVSELAIEELVFDSSSAINKNSYENYMSRYPEGRYIGLAKCMISILEAKMGINDYDSIGFSAIHYASMNGRMPTLNWLIKNGANVNLLTSNSSGNLKPIYKAVSALSLAAFRNQIGVVTLLLENGSKADLRFANDMTSIVYAAIGGSSEILNQLVKYGANLKDTLADGSNLLTVAASNDNSSTVGYLITKGLDPNKVDNSGKTSYTYAFINMNDSIVNLIKTHGGDEKKAFSPSAMSVTSDAKMQIVDGKLRLHVKMAFADLSKRPAGFNQGIMFQQNTATLRTISKWIGVRKVPGTDNFWLIKADGEGELDVIEYAMDIDAPKGKGLTELFLTPGFSGKLPLKKGESAIVFGEVYTAPKDAILKLTWDKVWFE
jgi:ankyrin repeat protein